MFLQQSSRAVRQQWRLYGRLSSRLAAGASQPQQQSSSSPTPTARPRVPQSSRRQFHATRQLKVVKPVLLADIGEAQPPVPTTPGTSTLAPAEPLVSGPQVETATPLTRTQEMMFKTMTRSLNIPHFLYADEIDFSSLVELRSRLNKVLARPDMNDSEVRKLSYLPFVIKAVSLALYKYPILNSRVETDSTTGKPTLVMRSQHNIGVAMDTPSGLLVPVIKNVGSLNVLGIAAELTRLQALAHAGKLSPQDMTGGTITVSNIGNIGGTYLSPVVVEREVAILGIGRMRTVPAFSMVPGEEDKLVRKQICNFSWSADHRVIDGATMARAAEVVRTIVEEPDVMVMHLR